MFVAAVASLAERYETVLRMKVAAAVAGVHTGEAVNVGHMALALREIRGGAR